MRAFLMKNLNQNLLQILFELEFTESYIDIVLNGLKVSNPQV